MHIDTCDSCVKGENKKAGYKRTKEKYSGVSENRSFTADYDVKQAAKYKERNQSSDKSHDAVYNIAELLCQRCSIRYRFTDIDH